MIILGIDPGIAITGLGVIHVNGNKLTPLYYGAVETKSTDETPRRLNIMHKTLTAVFKKFKPQHVAIESLFFNKNVKTALTVGHARGVILLSAEEAGCPIYHYTPPEIKLAVCGDGRADKKQVQHMVKALLKLDAVPKPDDVADGLAIAICHSHSYRLKSLS